MRWIAPTVAIVVAATVAIFVGTTPDGGVSLSATWPLHQVVEGASGAGQLDGADGIAKGDADGDGLDDLVSGAEQGLRVAVAFHPGLPSVYGGAWPHVLLPTVNMCSVEDAIFCDVDDDGALDVVAACETGTARVEIMFAPEPPNTRSELLNAANWTRVTLDDSANRRSMRVACADWAGDDALELVVGGKDDGVNAGELGYYSSATPRTGSSWTFEPLLGAGWVMQMYVLDFDGDAALDIVYSDKEAINVPTPDNNNRGLRWLDCTAADPPVCTERTISAVEGQWKWFDLVDWDGDTDLDVVACRSEPPSVHEQAIFLNGGGGLSWSEIAVPIPTGMGFCQHTTAVDVDLDGRLDIGTSYSNAEALSGLGWQKMSGASLAPGFTRGEIAGVLDADGDTKFDNLLWWDVDDDGDMDAVTTEQHVPGDTGPGLGIVIARNPRNAFVAPPAPPAVLCTTLTSGSQVGGSSAVTASVSPASGAVVYAVFQAALAANPAAPTVTGNGLTYVQEETVVYHNDGDRRMTAFRAMGASPSAGAITASYGGTAQTSHLWSVIECTGVDPGGTNGSAATVQSVTQTAAAATTLTNTLAALAAPSSVHLAFAGHAINNTFSPDAQFLELSDNAVGTGTQGLSAQWATNETDVTPTWPASANAGAISLEVKIAP